MLIVTSLTQPGGRERVTEMIKQSNAHRHKANSTRRKRKGHKNEQNDRMRIVTRLTQLGGRERVRRMSKQSNAHRCKLNSTLRKRNSHKNEETIECMVIVTSLTHPGEEKGSQEWRNDRMLIVASLTRPGGWERVTKMNKRANAHRRKPNSTRGKRKGDKNDQTIEWSSSQA